MESRGRIEGLPPASSAASARRGPLSLFEHHDIVSCCTSHLTSVHYAPDDSSERECAGLISVPPVSMVGTYNRDG